ncbi:hypothetical protein [Nocardioides sp. 503]|uniref:hypothetical protein n=1 Tax=Nocardioides sp. 503 TaxID=2508326 RepID=UPI00106F81B0|nr:hypothetical protein [Nocardioides sp. 503]
MSLSRTRRTAVIVATAVACTVSSAGAGLAAEGPAADRVSAKRVILDPSGDQERTPDAPDTATFDDAQVFGDIRKVVVRRVGERVVFTYKVGDVLAAGQPGAAAQYFDSIFATEHRTLDTYLSTRLTRSSGRLRLKTVLKTHAGVIDDPRRTCAVRHVVRPARHKLTVSLKRSCLGTSRYLRRYRAVVNVAVSEDGSPAGVRYAAGDRTRVARILVGRP